MIENGDMCGQAEYVFYLKERKGYKPRVARNFHYYRENLKFYFFHKISNVGKLIKILNPVHSQQNRYRIDLISGVSRA